MTQPGGTATLTESVAGTSASYIAEIVGRRLGPYRLERVQGSGGMGTVYSAVDERYDARVAVKAVPASIDETRLRALKREFRTICEFSHPHVVEMYDLGGNEEGWYTAMELIEGEAFVPFLLRPCEAHERRERTWRAVTQLVQGLAALHRAGFIHRDLKSANVLVEDGSQRVVILDFGLAQAKERPNLTEPRLIGTPSHMAPELLRGDDASTASDWFALGVTLYEALVGKPGRGQDLRESARAAAAARDDWERALLALVIELLHPQPEQRPDAAGVFSCLGMPFDRTPSPIRARVALVAREAELQKLREIGAAVRGGGAAMVAVSGDPGIGKSFLTSQFLAELERGGALVCRARCHVNERIPFNAVDGLIEQLARFVAQSAWLSDGSTEFAAVSELFPALGDIHGFRKRAPAAPELTPAERRRRASDEIRRLVSDVASRQPLVLFVEDAHWADADSARLLQEVCGVGDSATPSVLLLWTERSGSRSSGFLREMERRRAYQTILLEALGQADAARLALALMPQLRESDVQTIIQQAAGSPLLLVKAAQHGASSAAAPGGVLKALVDNDLAGAGPSLRKLMSIIAIASAPLAIDVAFKAADVGSDVHRTVAALRRANLIAVSTAEETTNADELELYHETLRAPLTVDLAAQERIHLHGTLARTLEATARASSSLIAAHFKSAEEDDKAAHYAEQAGHEAQNALAFAAAAAHFRDALNWGHPDLARKVAIERRLADSLFDAGYCADAAETYAELRADLPPDEGARVAVRQATAWFSAGHVDRAVASVAQTLQQLKLAAPRDGWLMPAIALQVMQLRLRGASYALDATAPDEARAFRADLCWAMGQGLSMFLSRQGAYFALRSLREAGPLGDAHRIGRGLAFLGGICANLGHAFAAFGEECLDNAETIGARHGDLVVQGWTRVWRANASLVQGRFQEAATFADTGTDLMERGGYAMSWECNTARCFALMARERLGDLVDVEQRALAVRERADARRDLYGTVVFGLFLAQIALTRGRPERARQLADEAMRDFTDQHFTIQHFYALRLRVQQHLYGGDAAAAFTELSSTWERVLRSDAADVPSARLDGVVLRAQVELALALQNSVERRTRLRAVRKLCSRAATVSAEGRAHALLLAASEQRILGANERARALARDAAARFQRLGMALWASLASRAESGAAGDARNVAQQEAELFRLGVGDPARWAALVTPGF